MACTHYELVLDLFKKYCPNTKISCNSENINGIINSNKQNKDLSIHVITSKPDFKYYKKILKLINGGIK